MPTSSTGRVGLRDRLGARIFLGLRYWSAVLLCLILARSAWALDQTQVFGPEIADPGQFVFVQHLSYARGSPETFSFPGRASTGAALVAIPELAFGLTDWWEVGVSLPLAAENRQLLSDGVRLRSGFLVPDAENRSVFYGVNFTLGYSPPKLSETKFGLSVRPILGFQNSAYEFVINPIFEIGIGKHGETDVGSAVRLVRKLAPDFDIGIEHFSDFGKLGDFAKLQDQQHTLFAVTDFRVGDFDVNFGVGHGLTPGSERFVVKAVVGYAFPVPGEGQAAKEYSPSSRMLANPFSRNSTLRAE